MFFSIWFCIPSLTSIFPISFSKYTEFSKGNSRIITDPAVGRKNSCPSLLLHHPFEHVRAVQSFLCWHFILNVEGLCLLCPLQPWLIQFLLPSQGWSFSSWLFSKVCIFHFKSFGWVHTKHYLIPLLFLFLQEEEMM